MEVRNIFQNLVGGLSRVSIDKVSFNLVSESSRISALNSKLPVAEQKTPALVATEVLRNKKGEFFNKYVIDGVELLYKYDFRADNAHEIFMDTKKANELYTPYNSEYAVIDLDTTSSVEGFVSTPVVA